MRVGGLRLLGWFAGAVVTVGLVAPIVALVAAAGMDRGPGGAPRTTLLYAAMAVSDPFVWSCLGNSLAVAVAVAFGSAVLGVALARQLGRRAFWGRPVISALAFAPVAVPSVCAAIGARAMVERIVGDPAASAWLRLDFGPRAWLAWVWVGLAGGVPLVALATRAALARVEPAWIDAARLAGATRRQAWRTIAWPIVRPEARRAIASVFTLTLLDPGAPIVLGLRRTLGFQVVEAALAGPAFAPRAAVLTGLGLVAVVVGRSLLRSWARSPWPDPPLMAEPFVPRAGWSHAAMTCLLGLAWAGLALTPAVAVGALALGGDVSRFGGSGSIRAQVLALAARLSDDPASPRLLTNSLTFGAVASVAGLALAALLVASAARRPGRGATFRAQVAVWLDAFPPLALGVGVLMIPPTLQAVADVGAPRAAIPALRGVARILDPIATPGVALAAALTLSALPRLVRAAEFGRLAAQPRLGEAARTLGASGLRAWRCRLRLWLAAAPTAALVLSAALAATSLAPAIVLAPLSSTEPVGPAVLTLADEPGGGLRRASAFALVAIALNLVALGYAARRARPASAPLGLWFRG